MLKTSVESAMWIKYTDLTADVCCSDASSCTDGDRLRKVSAISPTQEVDDTIEQEGLRRNIITPQCPTKELQYCRACSAPMRCT